MDGTDIPLLMVAALTLGSVLVVTHARSGRHRIAARYTIPVDAGDAARIRGELNLTLAVRYAADRYGVGRADAQAIVADLMAGRPRPTCWREALNAADPQLVPQVTAMMAELGPVATMRWLRGRNGLSLLHARDAVDELAHTA